MAYRMKFDVNPSVSMIASQLGVDPSTISVTANADGTYTVSMPTEATPQDSQLAAIATRTAAANPQPQGTDIVDILTQT